jgi:hypothetical protein
MATLIEFAFAPDSDKAVVWKCSECDAAFCLDRITPSPSLNQLEIINAHFSVHCRHEHPKSPVYGLAVPPMNEDSAQMAFRVLRQATEGK